MKANTRMETLNIVNPLLDAIDEDVMGFLNEIQMKHPNAISFASGRPDSAFFNIANSFEYFNTYINFIENSSKESQISILNELGQYNRTKGIINDLVSIYLKKEEGIEVDSEHILITVGTQEALTIAVITMCEREKDVILVEDPSYIGVTHVSLLTGYKVEPIPINSNGICIDKLEERIEDLRNQGMRVKLVYVIPDYQNPTGCSMPLQNRNQLLHLASKHDFFVLEDNAYRDFSYEKTNVLPIKAYDKEGRVIYMRSFSKTIYPSLRLAALVTNKVINHKEGKMLLSDLMAKVKGYLTVNTPSLDQAVLGGMLIKYNYSLQKVNEEKVATIFQKRNLLLTALNKFLNARDNPWASGIFWNEPRGGFFLVIQIPFVFTLNDVSVCVQKYKVICTPMSFFYIKEGGENQIRLAFSNVNINDIEPGIERLACYFKDKLSNA